MTRSNNRFRVKKMIYTVFFLVLILLILTNSQKSTYYALYGLNLWFTKMIPSLLPFMILSGIMVRLQLTAGFASLMHPLLHPIWRVRKNVTYAMIMGFLCGFPMGARVTCDLLDRDMISNKEANFLLTFCNNIGPVYFTGFVLPLLKRTQILPYLIGMYGLPFLYGLVLRHTVYKSMSETTSNQIACNQKTIRKPYSILEQIDDAINSSVQGILSLGGYMILFNLLNIIPASVVDLVLHAINTKIIVAGKVHFVEALPALIAPILEITGGLGFLEDRIPLYSLLLLPFGGLSCMAQTYSIIRRSNLSIHTYVYHKLILTGITVFYYVGWKIFFPLNFLL
ncbi:MAG: hypothetical protein IKV27_06165 [Lachnospiraceae bacterium]|nr:hypothetical protein [Lachnospiraceae bacterium]